MRSFYLILSEEMPELTAQPLRLPRPELDEGNHLSYAVQWILFALMAFGALIWAIRREFEAFRIAHEPGYSPKPKRLTRSKFDENAEDSLLDKTN